MSEDVSLIEPEALRPRRNRISYTPGELLFSLFVLMLGGYLPADIVEKLIGHALAEKGFCRDWFEKITARHVLGHSSGMPHGESATPSMPQKTDETGRRLYEMQGGHNTLSLFGQ